MKEKMQMRAENKKEFPVSHLLPDFLFSFFFSFSRACIPRFARFPHPDSLSSALLRLPASFFCILSFPDSRLSELISTRTQGTRGVEQEKR